ncbi:hypothetical protein R3P38DRAFT_3262856 [Favolaschia claudopus]|uniref:Uncharacterized protein n=1 Tax=Favolaschia claudopus TaxID=2862362 RepID=A0AAW0CJT6_9AGAR
MASESESEDSAYEKKKKGVGRPRKKWIKQKIKRGKEAVKAGLSALLRSRSPSPSSPPPASAHGSVGVALSGEAARDTLLAQEEYGVASERVDRNQTPVWLQSIDHARQGYRKIATLNTEDLPAWFNEQASDALKNDYQPKSHSGCQVVKLVEFGHPGDSPNDIRARKLVVRWAHAASPELKERAIADKRPVWRWTYFCAGVHDLEPPPTRGGEPLDTSSESESEEDEEDNEDERKERRGKKKKVEIDDDDSDADESRGRWNKCGSGVRLRFEVTADDLAVVNIWQLKTHEDASPAQWMLLMSSRFLRLQILDRGRRFGASAAAIQRDLVQNFMLRNTSGVDAPLPRHRIPTGKQMLISNRCHVTRPLLPPTIFPLSPSSPAPSARPQTPGASAKTPLNHLVALSILLQDSPLMSSSPREPLTLKLLKPSQVASGFQASIVKLTRKCRQAHNQISWSCTRVSINLRKYLYASSPP